MADEKPDEKPTAEIFGRKTIKLAAVVEYEDVKTDTIVLNLQTLTGHDCELAQVERDAVSQRPSMFIEADKIYLAHLAASAAGVPYGLIQALPVKDYWRVTQAVQTFLLG